MEAPAATRARREGEDLPGHGERIERLLDDLRGMAGPSAWQRIEELLRLLVELYGAGLERLVRYARESGADAGALQDRACSDELLSSLLLLHGLHPLPVEERVRRAVEAVRGRLGASASGLELLSLPSDGTVRVRVQGARTGGCPSSRSSTASVVEQAIQDAAPEITRVEFEDVAAGGPGGRLVTIGGARRRGDPA